MIKSVCKNSQKRAHSAWPVIYQTCSKLKLYLAYSTHRGIRYWENESVGHLLPLQILSGIQSGSVTIGSMCLLVRNIMSVCWSISNTFSQWVETRWRAIYSLSHSFLDASTQIYKWMCPSVGLSVTLLFWLTGNEQNWLGNSPKFIGMVVFGIKSCAKSPRSADRPKKSSFGIFSFFITLKIEIFWVMTLDRGGKNENLTYFWQGPFFSYQPHLSKLAILANLGNFSLILMKLGLVANIGI